MTNDYVPPRERINDAAEMLRQVDADWSGAWVALRDNDQPSYAAYTKALARHWRLLKALVNEEAK